MRRLGTVLATLFSSAALALPGVVDQGQGTSLGNLSSGGIPGSRHNPAAPALALSPGQRFRGSLLSLVNLGLEAGPVDGFIERIEDLEGCLEDVVRERCEDRNGNTLRPQGDDSIQLDEAEALQAEFNDLLAEIGRDAYINLDLQLQLPSMPMIFRAGNGVIGLDIHATGTARINVLDDPLRYNPQTEDINTNTAVYLKTGRFLHFSASYARQINAEIDRVLPGLYTRGEWYGGARLSILQGSLAKVVAAIDSEDSSGETAFDRAEDSYEDAEESSTNIALDLGLMWRHQIYQAGLTLRNINAPSFDYGPVGVDCSRPELSPGARNDCFVAASFADRIALRESFELNPQATLEGAILLADGQARISAVLDLNAANSPTGAEYQWLILGAAYSPSTWWLPGVRAAWRSNLGEQGVDSIALGLTLFKVLQLDVSQSTDSVIIDGDKYPRALAISLGFEVPL